MKARAKAAPPVRRDRGLAVWAGGLAAGFILLLTFGSVVAVLSRAEGGLTLGAGDWAAIRFTVLQAALSAALSVGLAVPVARALARRRFAGRAVLVTLMGAPFILPVIVAVLGLVMVFGRAGWVSHLLALFGLAPVNIYGLHGVVIAHVFFNLPLATRLILQGWLAIPAERFRLAATLGMGPGDIARHLGRPMLRATLPGAFMVIFLICTTSFAVALALGGGPRATTVELAIYQAFRFDFDLSRAALLALIQLAISGAAALLALWVAVPQATGAGLDRTVERWDAATPGLRLLDGGLIALAALFLLLPLLAVALRGLPELASLPAPVWAAAWRSLWVAGLSVVLALTLAMAMTLAITRLRHRPALSRGVEVTGYLAVAVSPLVIGTGLFLILFPLVDPVALALPVTALVNAVMALPFALRALVPAAAEVESRFGPLADSLGMTGLNRLRRLTLPRLRRPLGFAAALTGALSMGDLGVIALFADPDGATLPLLLFRYMGSYRMETAAGVALLLLGLSLLIFWCLDRGGRVNADL
ncbi:thiamine/thiamine pyrophosphate ABC transporter permease ThiP [Oceaniglobus trochenteri]|uniref:thiamine/thiamine pyrophosphate ABC transporter permease ThiP n=1 Tax=Oceaniglobus trochenteri TaxID=2763260 RepID=UPI001CFFB82C|nr:thiamine/thiamine pyrophosphate ABC transporter permease ThiP [Oceaniglobus trochenteri]